MLHDGRFIAAVVIAALAGLVRGFSGFGSALIYMPLISAVYGPRLAAPTLLLIDTICSLPFTVHAAPQCNPREVAWVSLAGFAFLPIGAMALIYIDAIVLRWFIVALVLLALVALTTGWRYHGKPTVPASLATGALAGFGGGAVQIGAPPLLVFWLGGANRGRHRARQYHGLFSAAGRAIDRDLLLERAVHRRDDRTRTAARPAVCTGDDRRRLLVSRLE